MREIVPTVEQAGIDEGYLDLGELAPAFDDARALAEAVRAVVKARTRLSCSLGVATSKVVAKIASDRRKPGGLTVVRPGREAAFLAPFPIRVLPGRRAARGGEARSRPGSRRSAALAALDDGDLARLLPGKVGRMVRDRARGIDPRPLEVSTERISVSIEETFERDVGDVERLHGELRADGRAPRRHLSERGQTARTVTTKLRYPDFAIRTRSTSLASAPTTATRIGELACTLLDRALRDRPGPLRLVGVGLSGLADHAQLELGSLTELWQWKASSYSDGCPRALRRDGRAGRRAQLELPGVVRARARRVPRAVRRRLPAAARPGDRVARRSRRTCASSARRGSTTGCSSTPAASTYAGRGSGSSTRSSATGR